MTPCNYLEKELSVNINEGKKRNKNTECNKEIIEKIYLIFDIHKIEEEEKEEGNNSSKNVENKENSEKILYDINEIKAKVKEIFSLEPNDEDKNPIYKKKTGEKNRLDNLNRVIITLVDDNFIEDFNKAKIKMKMKRKMKTKK